MSRPLSTSQRDILDHLLSDDFPGANELRVQAATVTGEGDGMVLGLLVDARLPLAPVVGRTPVEAVVDGNGYYGGLLLFVEGGRLSALEYWWVTDEMPNEWPPLPAIGRPISS